VNGDAPRTAIDAGFGGVNDARNDGIARISQQRNFIQVNAQ
jgi:hypothetical protein